MLRDRPFLSDRYFFITVRLLKERAKLLDADFHLLTLAFNRTRVMHPFYLTAWVFLPDPAAAGHALCAPVDPLTISLVMKSIPQGGTSSMILMNRRRIGREAQAADLKNGSLRYHLTQGVLAACFEGSRLRPPEQDGASAPLGGFAAQARRCRSRPGSEPGETAN